jgi:hypothetical protein
MFCFVLFFFFCIQLINTQEFNSLNNVSDSKAHNKKIFNIKESESDENLANFLDQEFKKFSGKLVNKSNKNFNILSVHANSKESNENSMDDFFNKEYIKRTIKTSHAPFSSQDRSLTLNNTNMDYYCPVCNKCSTKELQKNPNRVTLSVCSEKNFCQVK